MKKALFIFAVFSMTLSLMLQAQKTPVNNNTNGGNNGNGKSPANNDTQNNVQLPADVKQVLDNYILIIGSSTLDEAATKFKGIAGGNLVLPSGTELRPGVKDNQLKRDFEGVKTCKKPIQVTNVVTSVSPGQGMGASMIHGTVYQIFIAKNGGNPVPVSIMKPEGHATITSPKVVIIGSF